MSSSILHFLSPPIPYFIDCGRAYYQEEESHIRRTDIGVFDLIVVTKGALSIGEGSQVWDLQQDEALILRPDAHHYGAAPCRGETEIIFIHFHTFGAWDEYDGMNPLLEKRPTLVQAHQQTAYLNHSEICSIFIPKYARLSVKNRDILEQFFQLEQEPRSLRNWKRQNIFQLFMQHMDQELSSSDVTVAAIQIAEKVDLFIRQHYTQKLSNARLQQELNYHPNYLAKCMLKIYGMTPMDYLTYYRVEQAKKLLLQTRWPITRVAEEVGFQHGSYFSYCFSNQEGISPFQYRKKFIGHL